MISFDIIRELCKERKRRKIYIIIIIIITYVMHVMLDYNARAFDAN